MNNSELFVKNRIAKMYAGSIAYGTSLPTSDVDCRGIFVGDPINIRTPFFPVNETLDSSEEDSKYFELSHFMKLCLDCNPNVVELLWTADEDIIYHTPAYDLLRSHREQLLSKKIAHTTCGYAYSQLKRIKGHKKWITNPQPEQPPQQKDYVSMVQWFGEHKLLPKDFTLDLFCDDNRLVPYGNNLYGLYPYNGYRPYSDDGTLNTQIDDFDRILDGKHPLAVVKFNAEQYNQDKEKWSNYWKWKKNRNETRAEMEEQFGYDCYSDDTEFLTSNGWKTYDQIDDTELLATFNRFTHKIEYQPIIERFESYYTGNMYHLTGYHVDTLVSANHRMFVREYSRTKKQQADCWDFVYAARMPETFDTLNVINPKTNRQIIPNGLNTEVYQHVDLLNYLRLVGWFISDGTLNFYPNGSVKNMRITQSKPQSKLTQTLTKQINNGKIKAKKYTYKAQGIANNFENVWLFDRALASLIYHDCGHKSDNKRLPKWCFHLTRREMTTLLVALLQGDGSQRNHQTHTHVYYTFNQLLADDIQRLAFLCGFETSKYGPYTCDNNFSEREFYQIYINMRPTKTRRHIRSASVEKIPVTNYRIVCFMVNNFTLVTRRNGHIGLHGNTKHGMHLVRLLRMGYEALTDHQINVKRNDASELLQIRNGFWSYDHLIKYAEEMNDKIFKDVYDKSSLRHKPNTKLAAQVLMEVQDNVWNKS